MRKKKAVTLQTLSEKLGLSVHTISKALRGLPGMSEETRNQIIELAHELGYRTKNQERAQAIKHNHLNMQKPFRFKLIISNNPESLELNQMILSGLQRKLSEYGHSVETVIMPTDLNVREAFEYWAETHQIEYTDGIFISPMLEEEQERRILQYRIPRIMINFPVPGMEVDSVVWDAETAIYQSVQYLISKGHRKILYVGGIGRYRGHVLRWRAFIKSMEEAGIHCDPDEHVTNYNRNPENKSGMIAQKLRQFQPTAILSAQTYDLAWIYYACSTLGKSIPEDYSLISPQMQDDQFIPEMSRPLLMIQESGARAAEKMMWRIANPHQPYESIYLQGGFFRGATVNDIRSK